MANHSALSKVTLRVRLSNASEKVRREGVAALAVVLRIAAAVSVVILRRSAVVLRIAAAVSVVVLRHSAVVCLAAVGHTV